MSPSYQDFVKKNFKLVGGSSPQDKMSNVAKLWRKQKGGMWHGVETPRASIHLPQPYETPVVGKHRRPPPIYDVTEVKVTYPERRRGIRPPTTEFEKKRIATIIADAIKEKP